MFVRVETGFKAGFSDPSANRIHRKIAQIHPSVAEKIRWMRSLKVAWMEFSAPRDKVVQAIQHAFKSPVTHWLFTGDLLPSAAGSTGTLHDLMQESPFRPGVFHGIEKRKRLQTHDEEALIILDAIQTILGRKAPGDKVVTGEFLIVEGAKLTQSDLEWVARNWFAHDKDESWSLLSEEELKHNARFQSEQVAKYLVSPQSASRSRLLQFRASVRPVTESFEWNRVEELLKSSGITAPVQAPMVIGEDWNFIPDVRFSSSELHLNAQTETEFHLIRHQLENFVRGTETRLQTLLAVLPEKSRLWRGENQGAHPLRIRDDFELALRRIAETTDAPLALMKFYEESHESEPSYFWTSSISVDTGNAKKPDQKDQGKIVDLFFVGFTDSPAMRDLHFVESLKAVQVQALKGEAINFTIQASGKTLLECLKSSKAELQYGFDLVIDGIQPWFKKYFESTLPLGLIWGVNVEQREWVIHELRNRSIPFLHFGTTSLTGDVRILEEGQLKSKVNISEFFDARSGPAAVVMDDLLDEPIFLQEKRIQPARFRNRYSVEELILKPETYHVSIAAPLVMRPALQNWSGLMVLSDLCGQEFDAQYFDYLLRKCTAMGGQIHSVQASFVNGLKGWAEVLTHFESNYGIPVTITESKHVPDIQAHWLGMQVVSKVADVRAVRTEEFKFVNDRIYWLPGDFEHPTTRWLSGLEGRYQGGLHGAVAIESSPYEGIEGVVDTLVYALLKRKLGAEVRIQHHFPGGFFVSVSENERFAVEEEWRSVGVDFEFVGRVTASPYLVIRNEEEQARTISIEDIV
ncbi:MAG: hypothetical protein H7333_02160 [Bdellovibrionales bacterium]|nr:hypothetical protein [Oligoflexia bacterium]